MLTNKSNKEVVREYENRFRRDLEKTNHELRPQRVKPEHLEEIPSGPLADGIFSSHYFNPTKKGVP